MRRNGSLLTESERSRLAQVIESRGEKYAALHFAIARQTLARALAGLSVQNGTAALIRNGLSALSSPKNPEVVLDDLSDADCRRLGKFLPGWLDRYAPPLTAHRK